MSEALRLGSALIADRYRRGAVEQVYILESEHLALAARLAEAVALIDEVDTLAVNNVTGCGTCSTIQNLTTRYLTAALAREAASVSASGVQK